MLWQNDFKINHVMSLYNGQAGVTISYVDVEQSDAKTKSSVMQGC